VVHNRVNLGERELILVHFVPNLWFIPSGKNRQKKKKRSERVRFFFNSVLKIQCHVVKNRYTPMDCFSAILPTGYTLNTKMRIPRVICSPTQLFDVPLDLPLSENPKTKLRGKFSLGKRYYESSHVHVIWKIMSLIRKRISIGP